MEELIQKIGRAKAAVDNGFSRVGAELQAGGPVELALFGAAGRIVRLSNSIVLLCKNDHAEEAKPLLKTMAATALIMRWLASEKDPGGAPGDLDGVWTDEGWKRRLARAGVAEADRRIFEDAFLERRAPFAPEWASGLPWAHVASPAEPPAHPERILAATHRAMEIALQALRLRWQETFAGAK